MSRGWMFVLLCCLSLLLLGCSPAQEPVPTAAPLDKELVILHYEDGFPQSLLDKFTEETGVSITYKTFGNYEEAEARVLAGEEADVVWMSNNNMKVLLEENYLSQLDYRIIPNTRYISPSFRDLNFDPGNQHHVPWVWGTTGLVYRSDLVSQTPVKWADLWTVSPKPSGVWLDRRTMFGLALMSLGYSINTSDVGQINEAAAFLEERANDQRFVEELDPYTAAYALADETLDISVGWAYDAQVGLGLNENVTYLLPEEGTMLWLEVMVVPEKSERKATAAAFINFLLQPENAAIYTNEFSYATVVQGSEAFVTPALLSDLTIFPTPDMLNGAELLQPLTDDAEIALNVHWERLVALTNEEP